MLVLAWATPEVRLSIVLAPRRAWQDFTGYLTPERKKCLRCGLLVRLRLGLKFGTAIQLFFNGPDCFTSDERYLLGETPEVSGLFCACGFNSIGILPSGGVGKALAAWVHDGHAPSELNDVDVRRMQPFQSNTNYLFDRTKETLGLLYQMHWPSRQYETARGVRRSPFHDRLLAQGAAMTEIVGYERPGFFAAKGRSTEFGYSYGKPSWFEDTRAECLNTASHVTLFDHSCFVKFRLDGNDALAV